MLDAVPSPQHSAGHGSDLKLHREAAFGEVSSGPHQSQTPANPPLNRTGTAIAISTIPLGVVAHSPCSPGRGGARNRANRESHELSPGNVAHLKAAERHAKIIGLPFTRMFTMHWEASGIPLAGMARATGRFTDLLAKALRRHGSGSAWLWTHEGGEGKGGHCHLLAHVPARLVPVVNGLQRGWLRKITGRPYGKRALHRRSGSRRRARPGSVSSKMRSMRRRR